MRDNDLDWNRLADYLSGRMPETERLEFESWIEAAPERKRTIAQARWAWDRLPVSDGTLGPVNPDAAWSALSARLASPVRSDSSAGTRRLIEPVVIGDGKRVPVRWAVLGLAAAVLLAVGLLRWQDQAVPVPTVPTAPKAMREVTTSTGQRANVRLDDGSLVVLGVKSRLRWGTDFGDPGRVVELEGEALFTVVHDAARPFKVRTRNAVLEDLGTTFSVRGYLEDQQVMVVVRDGQVAMGRSDRPQSRTTLLGQGDLGVLSSDGAPSVRHGVNVDDYQAFAVGRLVFANTPLPDAIASLQRWYDVRITLADSSLARTSVNGSFEGDPLSTVLRTLTASLDARYVQRGRTVEIHIR